MDSLGQGLCPAEPDHHLFPGWLTAQGAAPGPPRSRVLVPFHTHTCQRQQDTETPANSAWMSAPGRPCGREPGVDHRSLIGSRGALILLVGGPHCDLHGSHGERRRCRINSPAKSPSRLCASEGNTAPSGDRASQAVAATPPVHTWATSVYLSRQQQVHQARGPTPAGPSTLLAPTSQPPARTHILGSLPCPAGTPARSGEAARTPPVALAPTLDHLCFFLLPHTPHFSAMAPSLKH